MIEQFHVVSDANQSKFVREVEKVIEDMQRNELEVEIQFSTAENDGHGGHIMYSAMIIGRVYEE